jgi:hypothetical protein
VCLLANTRLVFAALTLLVVSQKSSELGFTRGVPLIQTYLTICFVYGAALRFTFQTKPISCVIASGFLTGPPANSLGPRLIAVRTAALAGRMQIDQAQDGPTAVTVVMSP